MKNTEITEEMANSQANDTASIAAPDLSNVNNFPFSIDTNNVIKCPSPIEGDYPDKCLPLKLKNPTTAKAKKLKIEVIDPSIYERQANQVACRIKSADRISPWIHALGILYFDHFGNMSDDFTVHWYDEADTWKNEGNRAICIDLTKNMQLLYKITLFVTTGVLQAQGLSKDLFMNRDFPVLKNLVEKTLLLSEDDMEGLKKAKLALHAMTSKQSDMENTIPKTVNTETYNTNQHENTVPKVADNENDNTNLHVNKPNNHSKLEESTCKTKPHKDVNDNFATDKNNSNINSEIDTTVIVKQTSVTLTFDDIAQMQRSFVDALTKVTSSQADFLKTAESSFSTAISEAIHPVVNAIGKLQKQIDQFQNQHDQNKEGKNATSNEVVPNLEKEIQDLQEQVHTLRNEKRSIITENLQLESENEIIKSKIETNKKIHEDKLRVLQDENRSLKDRIQKERDGSTKLFKENEDLKKKSESEFTEIMELRTQLSSMFTPQKHQAANREASLYFEHKNKAQPYALLLGTSNTEDINEEKLSPNVITTKKIAYTLDDTLQEIQDCSTDIEPDVVILHSLTNDAKKLSPSTCMEKLENIVNVIQEKWKSAKCVISLTTPRADDKSYKINCEILDGLVKRAYLENEDVYVSDNGNLWHGSVPYSQLLKADKFHLNDQGCSILASNIKYAMHTVLGIRNPRRSYSPKHGRGRGYRKDYRGRGNRRGGY